MRIIVSTFLLSFFISISLTTAQDIHWTQFEMSPLTLNPAKTGDFHGTARVGGLFRSQGQSIATKGYSTPAFYVDMPIIKGFRKHDWIGIGISYQSDKAGELQQTFSTSQMSAAYHLVLGKVSRRTKKIKNYLTLGVGFGTFGKDYKLASEARLANGGQLGTVGGGSQGQKGKNATEYSVGLQLTSELSNRTKIKVGSRIAHLGKVTVNQYDSQNEKLGTRLGVHGELDYLLNSKMIFTSQLLLESLGKNSITVLQGKVRYLISTKKQIDVSAGLGYRFGDALQMLFGANIKSMKFGLGYDLPVSGQAPTAIPLGGLELAASYIIKIYKKPEVDPVILCPRF